MYELIGGKKCSRRRRSSCSKKNYSCPKKRSCARRCSYKKRSSYKKKGPSFCAGKTYAGCAAYPSCSWTANGCRARAHQGEKVYTEVPMVFAPPEYTPDKVAETQKFLANLEATRNAAPVGGRRRKHKRSKSKSKKRSSKKRSSKKRSRH